MPAKLNAGRLLILVVLWLVAAGGGAPARAQSATVGTVTELVGVAVVTRAQASGPEPLAVGALLFEGDRIHTEAGARLRLRLRDGVRPDLRRGDRSAAGLGALQRRGGRAQRAPERAARHRARGRRAVAPDLDH